MVGFTRVRIAALAVLALGGAAALVSAGLGSAAPGPAPRVTPAVFAAASAGGNSGPSLQLRSIATGGVIGAPQRLGGSWTSNGFAFSPDQRYVYFTLIPKSPRFKSLSLEQLSVSTHRRRLIGLGEQPAVSPDGRLLAYASGENNSATIVVRDLASGQRRSVNLARVVGSKSDMLNASLAWLADGTQLAVFDACCAVATSTAGAQAGSDGYALHLIVVSVPQNGGLSARLLAMPGAIQMPEIIGTDASKPTSLLLSLIAGDRATIDRVTIGSSRATVARVLTIAHSLVVAFAPSGQQFLYLVGHNGPNLWVATLNKHRLTQRRLLITNPPIDAYAW